MGIWVNADGLYLKLGAAEGQLGNSGSYRYDGPLQLTELIFDATSLTATAAVIDRHVFIPAGVIITKVEVVAETAATSGGAATLNVGLQTPAGTEIDNDGLVAALALSLVDAVGDVNELVQGSTGHGALVGTKTAARAHVVANYGTAAFTAGRFLVRVYHYVPTAAI